MKKRFALCLLVCLLFLCACSDNTEDTEITPPAEQESIFGNDEGVAEEKTDIEAVLDGSLVLTDSQTQKTATIFTLSEINERYSDTNPFKYALCDLDGDGTEEILVEYDSDGDTAVLHKENDIYKVYHMAHRARLSFKTDGSMQWSGSADHNGLQRVEFSDGEMKHVITLESKFDEDVHYLDGLEISREKADEVWEAFEEKTDVEWTLIEQPQQ